MTGKLETSPPNTAIPDDTALRALLEAAGVDKTLDEVKEIAAGIAAAPARPEMAAALDLIAPDGPAALRSTLSALIDAGRAKPALTPTPGQSRERLDGLRDELASRSLDGFLIPMADEYQNEFVPERALRIAWLSGFTGSAGLIVVLADKAAIFTDGRYTLQVAEQVVPELFACHHIIESPPDAWVREHLQMDARLGYDPWLFTADQVDRFRRAAEKAGGTLAAVEDNPLDTVWRDQPPKPLAPVVPHDLAFAGEASSDKRHRIGADLAKAGLDAAVITAPDSIAWLLNIRGGDVPRTPLPLSTLLLRNDGQVDLFADRRKLSLGLEVHLGNEVQVRPDVEFGDGLNALAGKTVQVDPAGTAAWVFERLQTAGAEVTKGQDPCQLPKACKNEVELAGARNAHIRDGAAVSRFLCWLEREAPAGEVDEMGALERLAAFRRENEYFQDLSFDTISGAGPNGAIVHYRATPESNRVLEAGDLYLVDSGAQYLDGTTDITRTIAIGVPTDEMRDRFTRVLKGHIALATCRFPEGTTGSQLDILARQGLWQVGLDFDHGTGHGVGSYLGVHEGPQRISKVGNPVALRPGMVISNEPGYYKTGAYGIRIENLVTVSTLDGLQGAERPMLAFETLTKAPIDRNLLAIELLTDGERAWLNAYHDDVKATLTPLVDGETAAWIAGATAPA